jgi:hypothetical protein
VKLYFNVLYDIALFTKLANIYLSAGNVAKAKEWFETAYLDCSINAEIQKVLHEHLNEVKEYCLIIRNKMKEVINRLRMSYRINDFR